MKNNTKPYQIIMHEPAHRNFKVTASKLDMTKGDFIQNLCASLEHRLTKYRNKIGFSESARSDELDTKLMKLILLKDKGLSLADTKMKLNKIKIDYEYLNNKPNFTL